MIYMKINSELTNNWHVFEYINEPPFVKCQKNRGKNNRNNNIEQNAERKTSYLRQIYSDFWHHIKNV